VSKLSAIVGRRITASSSAAGPAAFAFGLAASPLLARSAAASCYASFNVRPVAHAGRTLPLTAPLRLQPLAAAWLRKHGLLATLPASLLPLHFAGATHANSTWHATALSMA